MASPNTPVLKNHSPKTESDFLATTMSNRSRTPSFSSSFSSSSSSSSSSSLQRSCSFPCNEPAEPPFFRSSGVIPFSWEHQPGIPKNHAAPSLHRIKSGSFSVGRLPLPPSSTTTPTKPGNSLWKKSSSKKKSQRDPFAAAMAQCSKDDDGVVEGGLYRVGAKLSRSLSGRLGVIVSCKHNCAVSEAIVRIPAASRIIDAPNRLL